MPTLETTKPSPPAALAPASSSLLRSWLGNRRVLVGGGLALTGTGLVLGWDWLSAVGIAPLLISAAPCLLMCALGLCMMGRGNQACSGQGAPQSGEPTTPTIPPASP